MSYTVIQKDAEFKIKKENFENVLNAFRDYVNFFESARINNYSMTSLKQAINDGDIRGAFEDVGWDVYFKDEDDDIVNIEFNQDWSLREQGDVLKYIAPFVEEGSYIEMFGEDGQYWRWIFKDGQMFDKSAVILWD